MAQTVVITDDLDGSPDAQTVTFALNGQPWEVDLSAKNLEKLQKALQPFVDVARTPGAGSAAGAPTRRRRTASTAPSNARVDYRDPENAGLEHRGICTEEEKAFVRDNLDVANANRARHGQPPIDPQNEKHKRRYGL